MGEIRATVKVKVSDMFCFLMHYSYASTSGLIGLLFSVGSLVLLLYMWGRLEPAYTLILIVCALLFTVINPAMLYKRAKKQVATSPSLKEPIKYVFSENGIHMEMGREKADIKWADFCKIKKVCGRYIFYINHIRANVVPAASFEGEGASEALDAMIKKCRK